MNKRPPILVSACLLGVPCRYDGRPQLNRQVLSLLDHFTLIPVCPEQLGGLPTPRPSAERCDERVLTESGDDVTEAFSRGAEETLRLCSLFGCRFAVLKSNSPSCGCGRVYDGTFSGKLVKGEGVSAALLRRNGVTVLTEEGDFSLLQ